MSTTTLESLLPAYFRHTAEADLSDRTQEDLDGTVNSHRELADSRPQGTAVIRVLNPTTSTSGWSVGGRSVVEVVTDDMPFLVDSVTAELTRQGRDVQLVIHPVFDVARSLTGEIEQIDPVTDETVPPQAPAVRESWMHIEVGRIPADEHEHVQVALRDVLQDVRDAVEDSPRLAMRVHEIIDELRTDPPVGIAADEVSEAADLLDWLGQDNFALLGYREYVLEDTPQGDVLRGVPGSGLGILRPDATVEKPPLPSAVAAKARERTVLVLAKANSRSTVESPVFLDHIGVKTFDESGDVTGERRFLGLFTNRATTESITRIPVLRHRVAAVLHRGGFDPASFAGKTLIDTLESFPRDELFHTPAEALAPMAGASLDARGRRMLRIFMRPDTYQRYVSVMVSLPRDRYSSTIRERFAHILTEELGGTDVDFTVRISDSTTARVHFVVHVEPGTVDDSLLAKKDSIERQLAAASRSWRDDLATAVLSDFGDDAAAELTPYLDALPEAYKEDFSAAVGAADLGRLVRLSPGEVDLLVYEQEGAPVDEARLKVYRVGEPLSLSQILPMLTSLGLEVTDERPYVLSGLEHPTHVYDFGLRYAGDFPEEAQDAFTEALRAMWDRRTEVDGFNKLVLAAGIDHRQVTVLRAYAKYMRQCGTPFAPATIQAALHGNVQITQMLVGLFEERFDPARPDGSRAAAEENLATAVTTALDEVASLDHDRIIRAYLAYIQATLRTNYFRGRTDQDGFGLALKFNPEALPDLPQPRPAFEIFVYSPVVEGVHLRFGKVARGGLRWSDRRDDFRTEVLGLVKAQQVKNTVIIPVGAKGGFVPKRLPSASDREAWLAEGRAAYTTFIRSLLDVTDNRLETDAGTEVVPPPNVVRHDDDDSYLVVAADKGTATFSDLANAISSEYDFWLGDAFASGGSRGYDHKAMGITARGAWVAVQRHFREMGVDCQNDDFTVVGIGDMSGDVFGNGMLLSEHIRLVAAFDHRDIFIDPNPDAAVSFRERKRLFEMPRSSWKDYDSSLISSGGGVFSRALKKVSITDEMREALGIGAGIASMTPAELISAILAAPADLLWNGGIGTYVKASTEPHSEAGDKSNDAIRIDGRNLRVKCVGEGGNLGLTQAGRVEYALAGGRINTDAIDNSAGVDSSDHEVNLKILLDRLVVAGELDTDERNGLLEEMTEEVADLVLRDNDDQNLALANAAANAVSLLHVHEEQMEDLEKRGVIDRAVEGLPSTGEVRRRLDAGTALSAPEQATLMSWTKIELERVLTDSDLPDDPYFVKLLHSYFPVVLQERFTDAIDAHPLRREIVVTQIVNDLVDGAGMTFWQRLSTETGAGIAELVRANCVAREIFGWDDAWAKIAALDHQVDAAVQTRMRIEMRTLVERATRWLVGQNDLPERSADVVERFRGPVREVVARLPELISPTERRAYEQRRAQFVGDGVPEDLASEVAGFGPSYMLLGVADVALAEGRPAPEVALAHAQVAERLGLATMLTRIVALPRDDVWESMARAAIREDLHAVHATLTSRALADPAWLHSDEVAQATRTLQGVCMDENADLARLSVGLRVVRSLAG